MRSSHRPSDLCIRNDLRSLRWLTGILALSFALCALPRSARAAEPCAGIPHCQNLGPFTATVVKVNVTRQDNVTAYQGVRTTVRFTNLGRNPIVLAYRDHTSLVTDNNGQAYKWSAKAYGIGLVTRDSADPQFEIAPGESREASFDGVLQYSMRRAVAGNVFTHDITIVQLSPQGGQRVREARDYALAFSNLSATSGFAAGAAGAAVTTPVAPPFVAESGHAPTASATVTGNPVAPAAGAGGDACAGAQACQSQGPVMATVVRVNVTDSGGVTAYHGVRTTVRFTNIGSQPLILGFKRNSGTVTDNQGLVYRHFAGSDQAHVFGMGLVDATAADPQFRLAPGESREASFEAALQYSSRRTRPGNVFTHDLTIAQLAVVGPSQVRTVHEYALSFSNLTATVGGGAGLAGVAGQGGAQAVNTVVEIFKALKK